MQRKKYDGGYISDITNEYKENLIKNKIVDNENCRLIEHITPIQNEGRKNDGIGFVKIDGVEYFLKYHTNLIDEFRTGYYLSKLHLTKVFKWYGMSAIVVFTKSSPNCISYDRIVHK